MQKKLDIDTPHVVQSLSPTPTPPTPPGGVVLLYHARAHAVNTFRKVFLTT